MDGWIWSFLASGLTPSPPPPRAGKKPTYACAFTPYLFGAIARPLTFLLFFPHLFVSYLSSPFPPPRRSARSVRGSRVQLRLYSGRRPCVGLPYPAPVAHGPWARFDGIWNCAGLFEKLRRTWLQNANVLLCSAVRRTPY